ncbi:TRAF3-interacting protein 1 [Homalodisca vitripennis]|uniref:TRAF3-interacting protein 1 n=1 Tax=Homalodisca vitripennis TaxID=197043 RepID=UPI001EEB4DB9|nr:TRAF3-interacting protein 1 [Homalodisca vitripennis]
MSEDVKLEVIRTTQDSLSRYIKKPPLTEKLLRKPPFRYLHDITTSVMRETGYLQGLYSQDELNPENIKDRESKIAFLEKLIAAVNLSSGINVTARPNKIVAGLDVAKTNELLQAIAKALEKKVDSAKAVEQVLSKKSKGAIQQNPAKKESSKNKAAKEVKTVEAKNREARNSDSLKRKTKDKVKNVEKPEPRRARTKKEESPTKVAKAPILVETPVDSIKDDVIPQQEAVPPEPHAKGEVELTTSKDNPEAETKLDTEPALVFIENEDRLDPVTQEKAEALESETEKPFEDISKQESNNSKQEDKKENVLKSEEELKRPQSARAIHRKKPVRKPSSDTTTRSPSKVSESRDELESVTKPKEATEKKPVNPNHTPSEPTMTKRPRTAARPASARPGAPRVRDRGTVLLTETDPKVVNEPVNLIVDSKDLPKDDDETLVTVEASVADITTDQVVDASDQGHLVSQILETQKELEDTTPLNAIKEASQRVDITWGSGRQEAVIREVDKLRSAIQALTRAANPLGKLIDFLQEDVESMQGELETWVANNKQLATQLQGEERLTEESIEPLVRQLEDIEQLIEEQLEETSVVKAAIIRNDERLTRLLHCNTSHLPG